MRVSAQLLFINDMNQLTELSKSISKSKCFDGWVKAFKHPSDSCNCDMQFSIYLPPLAASEEVPALYWLSGLTCTHENFMQKAGAQQYAAKFGLALIAPDTSPRGVGLPGEDDDWDFGTGAGFYLNAEKEPWAKHYNMYDYIVTELPTLIEANFPIKKDTRGIFGHSMGGHGALIMALKNPNHYASVSAFSPICAPSQCPWGEKAFIGYLGDDKSQWAEYDANELIQSLGSKHAILIDQGSDDEFLKSQLNLDVFTKTCEQNNIDLNARIHEGYDHSYYFIASFIEDHIAYHAKAMGLGVSSD